MSKLELVLVAHNIRSLHNVGSLFRTADGAGVNRFYLTGYTGCPPRKEISKTALGAELSVPWEHHWELAPVLNLLRAEGYAVAAIERNARSQAYTDYRVPARLALILGNEVTGLDAEAMGEADTVLEVPMLGQKESLNVAVCGGVMLYGIRALWSFQGSGV
jgi:tRNA G18 (ribose-2'-O)-methylase SpoU